MRSASLEPLFEYIVIPDAMVLLPIPVVEYPFSIHTVLLEAPFEHLLIRQEQLPEPFLVVVDELT